jgi:putative PIN family toxin of toxin-antitoxin system
MRRLRVVFDANVVVSAALLPRSVPRQAFNRALAEGDILMSLALVTELNDVLYRDKFDRYVPIGLRIEFLAGFVTVAEWVEVTRPVTVCRDPKDNHILELAINGGATHVVTGDDDLLALHPFRGVRIVPPLVFLNDSAD